MKTLVFFIAFLAIGLNGSTQQPTHYRVELQTAAGQSYGAGSFTLSGSKLVYNLEIPFAVLPPEIHGPASPGAGAPVLFTLSEWACSADDNCGSLGELSLTSDQANQLDAGLWYVSVDGIYRGPILQNTNCQTTAGAPVALTATIVGREFGHSGNIVRFGDANLSLHGTLLDYQISLPAAQRPYTAVIMRNGRVLDSPLFYLGTLDCAIAGSNCVAYGQVCLPQAQIPELLNGRLSLFIWYPRLGERLLWGAIGPVDGDRDGVPDFRDACPNTLPNEAVNADGCSIEQLCPCDGPWGNHAEFVNCMKKVASEFFNAGLITRSERRERVTAAARSDCGKRR